MTAKAETRARNTIQVSPRGAGTQLLSQHYPRQMYWQEAWVGRQRQESKKNQNQTRCAFLQDVSCATQMAGWSIVSSGHQYLPNCSKYKMNYWFIVQLLTESTVRATCKTYPTHIILSPHSAYLHPVSILCNTAVGFSHSPSHTEAPLLI